MDTSTLPATRLGIRYRNKFADYLYFNGYAYLRSPVIFVILGIIHIVTAFQLFSGILKNSTTSGDPLTNWIGIVVTGCGAGLLILSIVALTGIFVALAVFLITRSDKAALIERSITLSEDAIIEETEFHRLEHKWAGIVRVARKHGYIIVFIAPFLAHIIPRRAFANSGDFDRFYSEIQARVAKSGLI